MWKKRVTEMKIGSDTYAEIMKRKSPHMHNNAEYRSMLVSLKPHCFVETEDGRGGNIVEIRRNSYDIPLEVMVTVDVVDPVTDEKICEREEWINVGDIVFWEAWDFIAPEYLFEDGNEAIGELMFESEVT